MNLWGHCFSQNANQKLQGFLLDHTNKDRSTFLGSIGSFFGYNPCLFGRAEILVLFGLHFGRKDDLINSFWIFILNSTDFTLFLCFVQILVYNQNGNSKTKVTSRLQIKYYCFGEGDQEVAGISRMPFLKPNHLMSHRKWSN